MNRKEFLKTTGMILPASLLGGMPQMAAAAGKPEEAQAATPASYLDSEDYRKHAGKLKFRADGTFKIVQFTDIHWAPGNPLSEEAAERMNEVLDAEKPDLVYYTGDLVWGKPAAQALDRALAPVLSRKLPFAVTWGNHDDEQDMTRAQLSAYIRELPGNLTGHVAGITGESNYILPIASADGRRTAFALYTFDSLAYSPRKEIKGYDWMKPDQIAWYRACSAELTRRNGGTPLPALAFFHIPLPEYNQAAAAESALLMGIRKEKACAPAINTGLYTAMLEAGDVMGTFVGHDHVNDYVVYWNGLLLGYGRFTGGKTVYHDVPGGNGARVIELQEGARSFRSWIVLKGAQRSCPLSYPDDLLHANA